MAGADEVVVGERVSTREELREQQREWHARRPETDPRRPIDPDDEDDAEEVEEERRLRRRWRAALYLAGFAVWALVMLALGVEWWDFDEHGPWLTPITPIVLTRALEEALLRRWPEWDRDHDPAQAPASRNAVERMGDRVRPRWAREADAPADEHHASSAADVDGATAADGAPDVSDRTRPSP